MSTKLKSDSADQVAPLALLPLGMEVRTALTTEAAAFHLNRKPQTLRSWACFENGPIRPIRVNGRLAWPVAQIMQLLAKEGA